MKRLVILAALLSLAFLAVDALAAPTIPATTLKVVLEKAESGYRWKVT